MHVWSLWDNMNPKNTAHEDVSSIWLSMLYGNIFGAHNQAERRFFPAQPISGLPCLQSFHMKSRLINLQGKIRKGEKKGGTGKRINAQIEMSFPSLQLLVLFFFFFFIWLWKPGCNCNWHWNQTAWPCQVSSSPATPSLLLREIKEGGGGSEGGRQHRESPDNSAAHMPVFEELLLYASLIYLTFVQGSQSVLGTWGVMAEHTSSFFLGDDM